MLYQKLEIHVDHFSVFVYREHGVVGDMRDTWPNARVRKNVSLIRTYHGFKGISEAFTLFFPPFLALQPYKARKPLDIVVSLFSETFMFSKA